LQLIGLAQVAGAAPAGAQLGRAGGGAHQAPAVLGVHQEGKAALAVVEQVFGPAEELVVARLLPQAVLKAHHLPGRALQLAGAAQRDQRLHRLVLQRVAQLAAHAAVQRDQAGAAGAGDALGAVQLDQHRRAAVGAGKLARALLLDGVVGQAGELQVLQPHAAAALHARGCSA
jgi:hypothetical protein